MLKFLILIIKNLCFGIDVWWQRDETAIAAFDGLLATFPLAFTDTGTGRSHWCHQKKKQRCGAQYVNPQDSSRHDEALQRSSAEQRRKYFFCFFFLRLISILFSNQLDWHFQVAELGAAIILRTYSLREPTRALSLCCTPIED